MTANYEWSQRDEKIRWYSFSKIARQIEELKMTTFFKKFASETHIYSASSDSTLCKRQNRHLRLPQTHVDVNRRILTKKINFPASRSGDFNGATPSVYLFTWFLVYSLYKHYKNKYISVSTSKTQPPLFASQDGEFHRVHIKKLHCDIQHASSGWKILWQSCNAKNKDLNSKLETKNQDWPTTKWVDWPS